MTTVEYDANGELLVLDASGNKIAGEPRDGRGQTWHEAFVDLCDRRDEEVGRLKKEIELVYEASRVQLDVLRETHPGHTFHTHLMPDIARNDIPIGTTMACVECHAHEVVVDSLYYLGVPDWDYRGFWRGDTTPWVVAVRNRSQGRMGT